MLHPSTFSIVMYDAKEKAWGIVVASKFLAVGSVVPWARANAGAVATQSFANTTYGNRGLTLMEAGHSAEETLALLLDDDPERELRQVGLVDAQGRSATYTGSSCFVWAGGLSGDSFAIQGNILAGEQVILAMEASLRENTEKTIIWRLYNALLAGDQAGGDRRGKQSAAILVVKAQAGYAGFNDRWVDYRVDDHHEPVKRLGELLNLHELYFGKSPLEERVRLVGEPLRQLQDIMAKFGYYRGRFHGEYDAPTQTALRAFIGNENFEDRTNFDAGLIDRPVLEHLLSRFG